MRINEDYKAVCALMQYRHLIPDPADPESEIGVEWTNDEGKTSVLWAYQPFSHPTGAGARIKCVTTGKALDTVTGAFKTEPWHTYLINPP